MMPRERRKPNQPRLIEVRRHPLPAIGVGMTTSKALRRSVATMRSGAAGSCAVR
jgi:hypothetical protein